MDVLALIIAVALIFYLMQVGFPRSARQLSSSRTFLRFYFRRIFSSWLLLGIAGVILLHDGTPLTSIGLLLPNPWWPTALAFLGVGILFAVVLVIHLRAMDDEQLVAKLAKEKRRLALPRTSSERLVWVGVSINAGIWEEIVFRGFLPWYMAHHMTLLMCASRLGLPGLKPRHNNQQLEMESIPIVLMEVSRGQGRANGIVGGSGACNASRIGKSSHMGRRTKSPHRWMHRKWWRRVKGLSSWRRWKGSPRVQRLHRRMRER